MPLRHLPATVAAIAAIGVGVVAIRYGTWAVGGSDSACYGLMAKTLASGKLQPSSPLALHAPWSNAAATFAPAGFIASPNHKDAASPMCAPGFSLLLVPFVLLDGPDGVFWGTPLAGMLLVWFAFVLARRLAGGGAGDWAGALAAVVVATSPIVLYQAVQPMNDVMTAMLWLAVVVAAGPQATGSRLQARLLRRRPKSEARSLKPFASGALTGLALLVRPNLFPAAVLAGIVVPLFHGEQTGRLRAWLAAALKFTVAALPGIAVLAWFNVELYGGPLRSGYGDLRQLFAVSFIPANAVRYVRWLVETHTVFPLLALAAPFVCPRALRGVIGLTMGVAGAAASVYLVYRPFDEWWYLRFLLPAVVLALVLSAAAVAAFADRIHRYGAAIMCCVLAASLGVSNLRAADRGLAFSLHLLEQRFRDTGVLVRDRLPSNAVFLTVWQSGTVRFYSGKETILWDALAPVDLDGVIAWLVQSGYRPYILVERIEETPFRQRFEGIARAGPLDWPPIFDVDRQARIFDPADRGRYLAGEGVRTEYVGRR